MLGRGELKPFHLERWDLAHRATNYSRWAAADGPYAIEYEHVSTREVPLNSKFSGTLATIDHP